MHIIADSAADLPSPRWEELGVTMVTLNIILGQETFQSGRDLSGAEFYQKLIDTGLFPTTSQPAPGDFAQIFQEVTIREEDLDLLVMTISSGLSGTYNAAKTAVEMTEKADITLYDSRNLSAAYGWQVEAAALANRAGWSKSQILEMLEKMKPQCHSIYTLDDMKYLVHGGRISHLQGLLANVLNLKPMIFVNHETGKYDQIGRARTISKAYKGLVDYMLTRYPKGTHLHVQQVHGQNEAGLAAMRPLIEEQYTVTWRDPIPVSPALGAHTGPSLIGLAFAPQSMFDELPFYADADWKQ